MILTAVGSLALSCQTNGPHYISKRDPGPGTAPVKVETPPPAAEPEESPKEVFVRSKELKIRQKAPVNTTGSLTDLNDPRAYLFGFERPVEVGQFIDVKVASNRAENEPAQKAADTGAEGGAGADDKSKVKPAEESALVKALPNLDPAGKNKPVLVKNIKMQILERYPNGDALVMYKRRSLRDGQAAEINVTARLSAEAMTRPDAVSTLDLADIDWRESFEGDIAERRSANWEDEYSLRISGFDETRSKDALALEEKREMLKSARDKLEAEMKTLGQERSKMTKERSSLLDEKAKDRAKIAELEQQAKDLQNKVDDLSPKDEAPEGDKPEDSAGDKKADKLAGEKEDGADKKKADKPDAGAQKAGSKKDDKKDDKKDAKPKAEPKKAAAKPKKG
jgi:hypothetical protein